MLYNSVRQSVKCNSYNNVNQLSNSVSAPVARLQKMCKAERDSLNIRREDFLDLEAVDSACTRRLIQRVTSFVLIMTLEWEGQLHSGTQAAW
jgi:hypothetical protein